MNRTYTADELIRLLGERPRQGHLPGDGSFGKMDAPWQRGANKQLPLGPHRYMAWNCSMPRENDEGCQAVSVSVDGKLVDEWHVVSACPKHAPIVELSPITFASLLPHSDAPKTERPKPEYEIVILSDSDKAAKRGPDWERLQRLLDDGYRVIVYYSEWKISGMSIYVLQLNAPIENALKIE
ncbi:MAG TPA: hypothetical protein VGZ02_05455 [Candidatus Baltobacteraceae bacterium]|jgi:hypothetical protein|nr:hypothetical protein [Candidatus Baltobacteraceae bacterium]